MLFNRIVSIFWVLSPPLCCVMFLFWPWLPIIKGTGLDFNHRLLSVNINSVFFLLLFQFVDLQSLYRIVIARVPKTTNMRNGLRLSNQWFVSDVAMIFLWWNSLSFETFLKFNFDNMAISKLTISPAQYLVSSLNVFDRYWIQ